MFANGSGNRADRAAPDLEADRSIPCLQECRFLKTVRIP
jgi:hypothetical protein